MQSNPFISVCIPAYNRPVELERLLKSLEGQDFRDFEVVITDDSPNDSVENLIKSLKPDLTIRYHRNERALGTSKNWNEAIKLAKGSWVKLMHDDDWFAGVNSLGIFAAAAKANPGKFIFSNSNHVYSDNKVKPAEISQSFIQLLKKDPAILIAGNYIGHPSVTMHPNHVGYFYDENLKWLVDIEFYIRQIQQNGFYFIGERLVNLGFHADQVTARFHSRPEMEIPEYYYFLVKNGTTALRLWKVYDAWWRLIRNFKISSIQELQKYSNGQKWPVIIAKIIDDQQRFFPSLIRSKAGSKMLMYRSYLKNKNLVS
jgi:glycosyltransferase involved in cell wall biosynthesis